MSRKKFLKNKICFATCKCGKLNRELIKIKKGFDELNHFFNCEKNKC